jgi:hypothetical protein
MLENVKNMPFVLWFGVGSHHVCEKLQLAKHLTS